MTAALRQAIRKAGPDWVCWRALRDAPVTISAVDYPLPEDAAGAFAARAGAGVVLVAERNGTLYRYDTTADPGRTGGFQLAGAKNAEAKALEVEAKVDWQATRPLKQAPKKVGR